MHAGVNPPGRQPAAPPNVPEVFDRRAVRRRLARAALGPGPHALTLQLVTELLQRHDEVRDISPSCLFLGTRRHAVLEAVHRHAGLGQVTALAPARACLPTSRSDAVVGDEEWIPFAPGVFDAVLAPVVLHTVNDLPGTFAQIRRVLRPAGLFLASLPAEGTLQELREVLLEAEEQETGGAGLRVPPFADVHTLGNLLPRAGFGMPVADIDRRLLAFRDLPALLRELAQAGERGGLQPAAARRLSRGTFTRACRLYEARYPHSAGGIAVSFDLVTLTARTPPEDT